MVLYEVAASVAATTTLAATVTGFLYVFRRGFERDQRETAARLIGIGLERAATREKGASGVTPGDTLGPAEELDPGPTYSAGATYRYSNTDAGLPRWGAPAAPDTEPGNDPSDRDRQFERVLVEYYSYGLTQARRSFYGSQVISAVGVGVILFGVGLAIWRAETSGDMYASIAASSAGVVSTIIGQLVHRRADIALQHMAGQTDSLRSDMAVEKTSAQAIRLLAEVADPEVRTRLQAGLIMKLAGSGMPAIGAPFEGTVRPVPEQAAQQ